MTAKPRPDPDSAAASLARVAAHIEAHADEPLTLEALAAVAGLSVETLKRRFKAAFGLTPKMLQNQARLRRFKRALRAGEGVTAAGYEAGYGSASRIHAAAQSLAMTPSSYRDGGEAEIIHWALGETVLGPLMMAATERGVCFASFGEGLEALHAELQAEFPRADLIPAGPGAAPYLSAWVAALDAHLAGHAPRPDLPLDLQGTMLQLKVWRFLLSVREGESVSYGEIARCLNDPGAVRAVGSACGANRIAVLVPCHRALRGDGGLGGYRWGLERKQALLDKERPVPTWPSRGVPSGPTWEAGPHSPHERSQTPDADQRPAARAARRNPARASG
jgi:AraC family transcriptional regulator of adaptative response/methylated-DNA-[protein]-cysteine methyltransferase